MLKKCMKKKKQAGKNGKEKCNVIYSQIHSVSNEMIFPPIITKLFQHIDPSYQRGTRMYV